MCALICVRNGLTEYILKGVPSCPLILKMSTTHLLRPHKYFLFSPSKEPAAFFYNVINHQFELFETSHIHTCPYEPKMKGAPSPFPQISIPRWYIAFSIKIFRILLTLYQFPEYSRYQNRQKTALGRFSIGEDQFFCKIRQWLLYDRY